MRYAPVCVCACWVGVARGCWAQILRIRTTHEELLSLLTQDQATQLRIGDAFKPFEGLHVRSVRLTSHLPSHAAFLLSSGAPGERVHHASVASSSE
jgi:hypothetical protein